MNTSHIAAAVLASLALGAGVAHADEVMRRVANGVEVSYGDLNLRSESGRATLSERVDDAVNRVCRSNAGRALSEQTGCRRQLREAVVSDANSEVRYALEHAEQSLAVRTHEHNGG